MTFITQYNVSAPVIKVKIPTFSSIPAVGVDGDISANHVLVAYELSNPSAKTGDWTWNTSDAIFTITAGTISGSTSMTAYLADTSINHAGF